MANYISKSYTLKDFLNLLKNFNLFDIFLKKIDLKT